MPDQATQIDQINKSAGPAAAADPLFPLPAGLRVACIIGRNNSLPIATHLGERCQNPPSRAETTDEPDRRDAGIAVVRSN